MRVYPQDGGERQLALKLRHYVTMQNMLYMLATLLLAASQSTSKNYCAAAATCRHISRIILASVVNASNDKPSTHHGVYLT